MPKIMLNRITLIFKGIEAFVLYSPARPGCLYEFDNGILVHIQVGDPRANISTFYFSSFFMNRHFTAADDVDQWTVSCRGQRLL